MAEEKASTSKKAEKRSTYLRNRTARVVIVPNTKGEGVHLNPKSKIIFIDQPEDNLGNKFITDTLVSLIRKIKFSKQVFLVTHNPSIVVYGDAESIIIAENNSNKISYKQVVFENQTSQKEICGILDGGEYIFDMRAKKYNIKRILKNNSNGNSN